MERLLEGAWCWAGCVLESGSATVRLGENGAALRLANDRMRALGTAAAGAGALLPLLLLAANISVTALVSVLPATLAREPAGSASSAGGDGTAGEDADDAVADDSGGEKQPEPASVWLLST